jgi:hypothetical protein
MRDLGNHGVFVARGVGVGKERAIIAAARSVIMSEQTRSSKLASNHSSTCTEYALVQAQMRARRRCKDTPQYRPCRVEAPMRVQCIHYQTHHCKAYSESTGGGGGGLRHRFLAQTSALDSTRRRQISISNELRPQGRSTPVRYSLGSSLCITRCSGVF